MTLLYALAFCFARVCVNIHPYHSHRCITLSFNMRLCNHIFRLFRNLHDTILSYYLYLYVNAHTHTSTSIITHHKPPTVESPCFLPWQAVKDADDAGVRYLGLAHLNKAACGMACRHEISGAKKHHETRSQVTYVRPMAKRLKRFGITYLVGKIKFKLFFSGFHSLSEVIQTVTFLSPT